MYFGWGLGYVNGFGMPNPLTYPNPQPKYIHILIYS